MQTLLQDHEPGSRENNQCTGVATKNLQENDITICSTCSRLSHDSLGDGAGYVA